MTKFNNFVLVGVISLVFLSACGAGGEAKTLPQAVPITSTKQAILLAETSGVIPTLNHDDTITGPDQNENKIRDDVEDYIRSTQDTDQQKAALLQISTAFMQAMTIDLANNSLVLETKRKISSAVSCIHSKYPSDIASKKVTEMRKINVNTKQRFLAYNMYNTAISGSTSLRGQGDGCEN